MGKGFIGVIGSFIMRKGVTGSFIFMKGVIESFVIERGVMGNFIVRKVIMRNFALRNMVTRNAVVVGAFYRLQVGIRLATPTDSTEEEDAFCSEALDENASILRKVWNI